MALERVGASDLPGLVQALDDRYPGIKERLLAPDGDLRR